MHHVHHKLQNKPCERKKFTSLWVLHSFWHWKWIMAFSSLPTIYQMLSQVCILCTRHESTPVIKYSKPASILHWKKNSCPSSNRFIYKLQDTVLTHIMANASKKSHFIVSGVHFEHLASVHNFSFTGIHRHQHCMFICVWLGWVNFRWIHSGIIHGSGPVHADNLSDRPVFNCYFIIKSWWCVSRVLSKASLLSLQNKYAILQNYTNPLFFIWNSQYIPYTMTILPLYCSQINIATES